MSTIRRWSIGFRVWGRIKRCIWFSTRNNTDCFLIGRWRHWFTCLKNKWWAYIYIYIYIQHIYTWNRVFQYEIEEHLNYRHDSGNRRKPSGKGFVGPLEKWVRLLSRVTVISLVWTARCIISTLTILEKIIETADL